MCLYWLRCVCAASNHTDSGNQSNTMQYVYALLLSFCQKLSITATNAADANNALQVVMGLLRPSPSAARRVVWRRAHWCVGRFALLFGAINLLLGAALVHQFKGVALVNWMLPVCLLLAVVGLLALTLEAFKRQVCL